MKIAPTTKEYNTHRDNILQKLKQCLTPD